MGTHLPEGSPWAWLLGTAAVDPHCEGGAAALAFACTWGMPRTACSLGVKWGPATAPDSKPTDEAPMELPAFPEGPPCDKGF